MKAPSFQSNSICMSSGSSSRMVALQAPPASFISSPTASQNNSFGLYGIWGPAVTAEFLQGQGAGSQCCQQTVQGTGWALAGCVGSI